jgi:hypothetical protein
MARSMNTDWMRTLEEMEGTIQVCLTSLEQYEKRFAELLVNRSPKPSHILPSVDPRLTSPDEIAQNVQQSESEAATLEQLIAEQEQVWNQWRERFAVWKDSLQQSIPTAHVP